MRHFLPRRPCLDAMDDSKERGVVAHARRLPFAANLPVLSIVVCRLPLGVWCLPFCLAAAVCPLASRLCRSPLPPWRLLLSVRGALSAAFCGPCHFSLSPYVEPPCSSCGVNAFETHITLRCNMRVMLVKRCIHTLETLHSLPSPCGAAHRHALVATRPPRLELPGLGQWGK